MNQPPPTILLVEDDEDMSYLVSYMLEREGYIVQHAADGHQAQRLIGELPPPSLVILDRLLPYLDGKQLLAQIRDQPDWHDVPVILLTVKSAEKDIVDMFEAGATDFVAKPFQPMELVTRVKHWLKRGQGA